MDDRLMRQGTRILNPGKVLRLRNAAGRQLGVVRGAVWITQSGDRRDPVIEAGGSFCFDRDGVALVQALGGEAVVVLESGLAPEGERPRAEPLPSADLRALRREALRLRNEAVSALVAVAALGLRTRWKQFLAWLARGIFGAPPRGSATREVARLNDHVLRDLGLRRDQVMFTGRPESCLHC